MKKIIVSFLGLILLLSISAYGEVELLGSLTKEKILEGCPDWQEEIAAYFPNMEVIEQLQAIPSEIKIEVYLGTWCSDTKRNVSAYFKILEMVDSPLIVTTYFGIPEEDESRKPYIEGKNIVKVPTFIVYIDNQEKGRIIEDPVKSVEEDLLDIINK